MDRNLRLRRAKSFLDVTPRPSYVNTYLRTKAKRSGRVREFRAIVRDRRRSSSIVSPSSPFLDTTPLPLTLRRGYTFPSFYPATPFSSLPYLGARILIGFSSTLTREGEKRVLYPRVKGRWVRLIRSGK